jgi:iron-sulfur cluster repair protein YtfE (RIC family)
MLLTNAFDIVFAAGIGVAAVALLGAGMRFLPRLALVTLTSLEFGAAIGAWLFFALRHSHPRELAVAAGGLTGCLLAASAAIVLRHALVRTEQIDAHLGEAQARLHALVEREAEDRAAELDRTLARARADSVSLLVEEERKLAEDHRREFAERERAVAASLAEALTNTQTQVEQRLAGWAQDLDRAAETTKLHIAELSQRQKQLVSDAEQRLAADGDRLAAESEELRAALQRLRAELDKALEDLLATAHAEVESHAAERRRALHELDERMRRRERELMERIQREEAEAAQRIHAGFEDVQRRQIEQLERIVERATSTYSDDAAQQFAALVKSSREDAARRLSRELDRAVEVFAREAEAVLAERLAHVGDAGAQRLERRLADATTALERRRDERLGALDERIEELEADIRRRLEDLGADAEAERAVIEARLQELLCRVESAGALQST